MTSPEASATLLATSAKRSSSESSIPKGRAPTPMESLEAEAIRKVVGRREIERGCKVGNFEKETCGQATIGALKTGKEGFEKERGVRVLERHCCESIAEHKRDGLFLYWITREACSARKGKVYEEPEYSLKMSNAKSK